MDGREGNDFFKVLVNSIRSSCYRFIDFKDNVSIRGFVALDVDGQLQQHFVLEELVSRRNENEERSFLLKALKVNSSKKRISVSPPSKFLNYERPARNKSRTFEPPPQKVRKTFHRTARTVSRPPTSKNSFSKKRECKSSSRQDHNFSKDRTDRNNLTFTLHPRAGEAKHFQMKATPEQSALQSCSFSTVNISPSKSMLGKLSRRNGSANNHSNNSMKERKGQVHEDKREGKKAKANCSTEEKVTVPPNCSEIHNRHTAHGNDPNGCSPTRSYACQDECQDVCLGNDFQMVQDEKDSIDNDSAAPMEEFLESSTESKNTESKNTGSIGTRVKELTEHMFSPIMFQSDTECSITSVQPNYLVGHTDDVIIITSDGNVNKHKGKKQKDEPEYHGSSKLTGVKAEKYKNQSSKNNKTSRHEPDATNQPFSKDFYKQELDDDYLGCIVNRYQQAKRMGAIRKRENLSGFSGGANDEGNDGVGRKEYIGPGGQGIEWANVEDTYEEKFEIHTAKRKRKFMKLMKYFKRGNECA